MMDDPIYTHLITLLEMVSGGKELAELLSNGQPHIVIKCNRQCHCMGLTWPLGTIQQLRAYVYHIHKIDPRDKRSKK